MRLITVFALAALSIVAACSSEAPPSPPLKVDLDQIVATGAVETVADIAPAGQPDEKALKVFAESGYEAVIDLRTPSEDRGMDEPAVVEELGMSYLSLPIDRDGITFENAAALDKLLGGVNGPVVLHCGSANRVGALLALRASANGLDDEAAIELGKSAGLESLEQKVRDVLAEK